MNTHQNNLTFAETERIALLAEEAGEVVQWVGKILRHGYDNGHPKYGNLPTREHLTQEIADVIVIINMMVDAGDIDIGLLTECKLKKEAKINKSLRYNKI